LILKEVAPETTVEEVIKATEAKLAIPDKVVQMPISL